MLKFFLKAFIIFIFVETKMNLKYKISKIVAEKSRLSQCMYMKSNCPKILTNLVKFKYIDYKQIQRKIYNFHYLKILLNDILSKLSKFILLYTYLFVTI